MTTLCRGMVVSLRSELAPRPILEADGTWIAWRINHVVDILTLLVLMIRELGSLTVTYAEFYVLYDYLLVFLITWPRRRAVRRATKLFDSNRL